MKLIINSEKEPNVTLPGQQFLTCVQESVRPFSFHPMATSSILSSSSSQFIHFHFVHIINIHNIFSKYLLWKIFLDFLHPTHPFLHHIHQVNGNIPYSLQINHLPSLETCKKAQYTICTYHLMHCVWRPINILVIRNSSSHSSLVVNSLELLCLGATLCLCETRVTWVVHSCAVDAKVTLSKTWSDSLLYDQKFNLFLKFLTRGHRPKYFLKVST